MLIFYNPDDDEIMCILDMQTRLCIIMNINTYQTHLCNPYITNAWQHVDDAKFQMDIPDILFELIERKLHKLHRMREEIIELYLTMHSDKIGISRLLLHLPNIILHRFARFIGWSILCQTVGYKYEVTNGQIIPVREPNFKFNMFNLCNYVKKIQYKSSKNYIFTDESEDNYTMIRIHGVHIYIDVNGLRFKESAETISRIFDICENMVNEAKTLNYIMTKSALN